MEVLIKYGTEEQKVCFITSTLLSYIFINDFQLRILVSSLEVGVNPYVGKCLLERTLFLGHQLCEVRWPVPFLAAFVSPVFPSGPHSLLSGQ